MSVSRNGNMVAEYYLSDDGRITKMSTPEVTDKMVYSYNDLKQVISIAAKDRPTTTFYSNSWRSESVRAGVHTVSYSDPYARFSVGFNGLNQSAEMLYDRLGRTVRSRGLKDGSGKAIEQTTTYDKYSRPLEVKAISKAKADGTREERTSTFDYYGADRYYQLKKSTDPKGRVTELDYHTTGNGKGLIKWQEAPAVTVLEGGNTVSRKPRTSFTYTSVGLPDTVTAPDGMVTKYNSYAGGLPTSMTADQGGLNLTTAYSYSSSGDLLTVDDPRTNGAIPTNKYDGRRRLETVKVPGAAYMRYVYDGDSRVTTVQSCAEEAGNSCATELLKTTRTYDQADRVLSVADKKGNTSLVAYDDVARKVVATDSRGIKYERQFDQLGRVVRMITNSGAAKDSDKIIEETAFNPDGTVDYVEDGRDTKTSYRYDHWNQLVKTDYFGAQDSFIEAYDTIGRPTKMKTRAGDVVDIVYNDLDWVTSRRVSKADGSGHVLYAFEYDIMGRVMKVTHSGTGLPTQTVSYAYDKLGRKTAEIGANGYSTGYAYDDAAGTTTLKYDAAGSYQVTYATDALGRVSTIKVGSSTVATYGYDSQSRMKTLTYGNGAKQDYTYETETGWLKSLTLDAKDSVKDVTFTYTRDDTGRIAQENISNDGYVFKKHQFTTGEVRYTANENNRYSEIKTITDAGQTLNPLMYLYDNNGNLTDDGAYKYSYDIENRLTEAKKILKSGIVTVGTYKYDALGRRSEKVTATSTTRYQYDGATVLVEYNASNVMQRRYV
ncbi:MAG: hypothetical protein OIF57_15725, partial [Marinobacterium sp.]|nr:hypothetical protein [Marinobacterium sp.]